MASLRDILASRLVNLRSNSDGSWQAQCPACAANNCDSTKSHLRIWKSGGFRCSKEAKDSPTDGPLDHNRIIRAFLYQDLDPTALAALNVEIIDPEPKLTMEKVYPEEMLTKLVPDHRYWMGRGVSEEVLRKLEGGLALQDECSKLSGRYVFPVRDDKRRIIGWTGRLVSDASFGPKHKHLVRVSKAVYPIHVTGEHIRRTRKVCFTEGIGDSLTWANAGIWNYLVLLGLNLNARVLGFLVSVNPTHIIISTNNDTERVNKTTGEVTHPGQDAALKLRAKLIPYFGEERVLIRLPEAAKDWGEVAKVRPEELVEFKAWMESL